MLCWLLQLLSSWLTCLLVHVLREDISIFCYEWPGLPFYLFRKPDIFFPVVMSEIQINASPESTQLRMQIEEAMSELRVTVHKIRKITRACEEDKQQFYGKTKEFHKLMDTAQAFMKNHCPKLESCPKEFVSPTMPLWIIVSFIFLGLERWDYCLCQVNER